MKFNFLFFLLCSCSLLGFPSCGDNGKKPATDTLSKDSLVVVNDQIRKDPGNLDLYLKRSKIYMQKKDYGASLMDIERILAIDSSKAEYLITAADLYFFTGKVSRTKQVLERAVEVNPENTDCLLRLAQLHHYLTNFDEEIALLDKVLQIDVHNAQAYFMKGMLFKEKGDTLKAISSMQTAVEQDPDHYNAYIQLGLLCATQKNPLAETYYLNALKINGNSEEAMYNLGMYYQESDNYNAAIETYTTLLKVNPHHFDAHFNLGMLHVVKLNVVDEAMKYFNAAIEDNPQDPRGYYGRGYCFEKKGDVTNAIADYKMALKVDPTYDNAAMAISRLEN
ncbi:MAG: tetratricopeptide repeat protein [Bacteroidota bacterium]|nr:tetratricopeptide repeat protein [Bacteroidota bacterium]